MIDNAENRDQKLSEEGAENLRLIQRIEDIESELETSHNEANKNLQFVKKLAMMIAHDLQSPFRFVITSSEKMQKLVAEKRYDELIELTRDLMNSGKHVLSYISDFVFWMKSIDGTYKPVRESVNLYSVIHDLHNFYAGMLTEKSNSLKYDAIKKDLLVETDAHLLKIIIRNLIDNANKYNSDTEIILSASVENKTTFLKISDNGQGITDKDHIVITKILQNKKSYLIDFDNKYGFKIIKHFSDILGIELNIVNKLKRGTTIELTIPELEPSLKSPTRDHNQV